MTRRAPAISSAWPLTSPITTAPGNDSSSFCGRIRPRRRLREERDVLGGLHARTGPSMQHRERDGEPAVAHVMGARQRAGACTASRTA